MKRCQIGRKEGREGGRKGGREGGRKEGGKEGRKKICKQIGQELILDYYQYQKSKLVHKTQKEKYSIGVDVQDHVGNSL